MLAEFKEDDYVAWKTSVDGMFKIMMSFVDLIGTRHPSFGPSEESLSAMKNGAIEAKIMEMNKYLHTLPLPFDELCHSVQIMLRQIIRHTEVFYTQLGLDEPNYKDVIKELDTTYEVKNGFKTVKGSSYSTSLNYRDFDWVVSDGYNASVSMHHFELHDSQIELHPNATSLCIVVDVPTDMIIKLLNTHSVLNFDIDVDSSASLTEYCSHVSIYINKQDFHEIYPGAHICHASNAEFSEWVSWNDQIIVEARHVKNVGYPVYKDIILCSTDNSVIRHTQAEWKKRYVENVVKDLNS